VYFRQNYLLAGLLISLASVGLLLVAVAKPGRRIPPFEKRDAIALPAPIRLDSDGDSERTARPLNGRSGALSAYRPLLRVLTAAVALAVVWVLARAGVQQVRLIQAIASKADASAHHQIAVTLALNHETAQAIVYYSEALRLKPDLADALNNLAWIRAAHPQAEFRDGAEAVRLAERACELTKYEMPLYMGTLAAAYAEAGRFDEAVATAGKARELALAGGQKELAEKNLQLMQLYGTRQPYREGDGN
jgi:tetratricopeptide (TPR) repeat protein